MSNAPKSAIAACAKNGRIATVVMLSLVASTSISQTAQSGSRDRTAIGIGVGVVGGLAILDAIAKSKETSSNGTTSRSRKKYSGKNEKTKRAYRDDDNRAQRKKSSSRKTVRAEEPNDILKEAKAETATSPRDGKLSSAADGKAAISTTEEIITAQDHLRFLGYEVGPSPGVLDVTTKTAIMKFQDSIKAETTGVLTVEQLQQMFVLAAQRSPAKP